MVRGDSSLLDARLSSASQMTSWRYVEPYMLGEEELGEVQNLFVRSGNGTCS
jgi:hypothetical protein